MKLRPWLNSKKKKLTSHFQRVFLSNFLFYSSSSASLFIQSFVCSYGLFPFLLVKFCKSVLTSSVNELVFGINFEWSAHNAHTHRNVLLFMNERGHIEIFNVTTRFWMQSQSVKRKKCSTLYMHAYFIIILFRYFTLILLMFLFFFRAHHIQLNEFRLLDNCSGIIFICSDCFACCTFIWLSKLFTTAQAMHIKLNEIYLKIIVNWQFKLINYDKRNVWTCF